MLFERSIYLSVCLFVVSISSPWAMYSCLYKPLIFSFFQGVLLFVSTIFYEANSFLFFISNILFLKLLQQFCVWKMYAWKCFFDVKNLTIKLLVFFLPTLKYPKWGWSTQQLEVCRIPTPENIFMDKLKYFSILTVSCFFYFFSGFIFLTYA